MKRLIPLAASIVLACGPAPAPTAPDSVNANANSNQADSEAATSTPPPPSTAAPSSDATPAPNPEAQKREQEAKKLLEIITKDPDQVHAETRGRWAANALSESWTGLDEDFRFGLESLSKIQADPTGSKRIIMAMFGEGTGSMALQKACGSDAKSLQATIDKTAESKRAALVMKMCGLAASALPDGAQATLVDWAAIVLAQVTAEALHARGHATPSELALARHIALMMHPTK